MKVFYLQMKQSNVINFIKFCMAYNISIFITWHEDDLFNGKTFFATVTNQPDNKITSEEKERLIIESNDFKVIKAVAL